MSHPSPPIKPATWEWYIPIYFWAGGIAGGAWLAAAAEDIAGEGDARLIRAARYLALGAVLGGTGLLVADLGRPERFLNMLRIVRTRSAMSLGSWGLTLFGTAAGAAGLLQMAADGLLGARAREAARSRRRLGRMLHVAGLPLALFVGGYTGVLLASTSIPAWPLRTRILGPLFLASAVSSGMAAVSLALELAGGVPPRVRRRLERAERIALATELGLALGAGQMQRNLPSARRDRARPPLSRVLMLAGGMAARLGMGVRRGPRRTRRRRGLVASCLTLAGSLALRYLVTGEGRRSAATPDDTWSAARLERRVTG